MGAPTEGGDFFQDIQANTGQRGSVCGVAKVLAILEGDPLREKFLTALDDPIRYAGSGIATTMTNRGYPVSAWSVNRHRNRGTATGCHCE